MPNIFAVLAVVPGNPTPQFSIVSAENPEDALVVVAQSYVENSERAQIVGAFTRLDLAKLDEALSSAEQQIG